MTPPVPMNPSRGQGHFPGSGETLEPGKQTSAHGYEGQRAAPADLLASPERSKVCATAPTGVRA
jgi:hypothetical protein